MKDDLILMLNIINIKILPPVKEFTKHEYEPLKFTNELWGNKEELYSLMVDGLITNQGMTLSLNTGKGKTLLLSKIITEPKLNIGKVIVFVANGLLQEQMLTELIKNIEITREEILLIGCNATNEEKNLYKNKSNELNKYRICIAVINSSIKLLDSNPDFINGFDLAIYDECHFFCSEQNKKLLFKL